MSTIQCPWSLAPPSLPLRPGEIHVWCASLDLPEATIASLLPILSEDERRRADKFRAGQIRNHFIAGRAALRSILARHLDAQPRQLRFDYQPHGKPVLAEPWSTRGAEFNVSHSHGLAVIAVAAGLGIGIDVESLRPMENADQLVERFFSDGERRQWAELPAEVRPRAFFHGWTCKEAWLKAVGSGLLFPLGQFSVSLDPAEPARMVSIRDDAVEAAAWWLESFEPVPGYLGAIAVRGRPGQVHRWRY